MSALSPNVVRRGEPSRTAQRVAALRAVHQLLDDPLVLPDPIALPILGAATEAALRADPFVLNDPVSRGLRAALVARCRFAEEEFRRCRGAGVRQCVVLGAGLDTLAYRSPEMQAPCQVFEVDHEGTQRWKRRLLAEAGIAVPASLTFVPMDFERDDLGEALARAGFHTDEPACVSWMGVSMYLGEETVHRTLRSLAGLAPGSRLCFDHRVPPALLGPVDRVINELIGRQAAAAGEPWLSVFDPTELQRQLLRLGFGFAVSVAPEDLNARYFSRRRDGLQVGAGLRIMCTGIGAEPAA